MPDTAFFQKPEKAVLYRDRWYIALMNFIQPGLGFALYGKWIDTSFTFVSYVIGFYMSYKSLSDPFSANLEVYIAVILVSLSFLYGIIKPILILSPNSQVSSDSEESYRSNSKVKGGLDRFWLIQFMNRLWPGLGLVVTRFWYLGLALILLGIGMYVVPSQIWPEQELWVRKILFVLTFGAAFLVTLSVFGYGGRVNTKTWIAAICVGLLSLLNLRYTDMIRENFAFIPIGKNERPGEPFDIKTGDFVVAKRIDSEEELNIGELIVYGDNNYRAEARILPFTLSLNRDSVFARAIKVLYPESRPLTVTDTIQTSSFFPVSQKETN